MSQMPTEPLAGPSAWLGRELAGSSEWIAEFNTAELAELERTALRARDSGRALRQFGREDFDLPQLRPRLEQWREALDHGRGFVLLRGLPVQRWGVELAQLAYLGLGLQLGEPASQNAAGDILGHVRDTGADPDDPAVRLYRTRRAQPFHTDGADIIGLLCLQSARAGGESHIVSSVSVFNRILRLRPDLAPLMFENFHFDRNEEQAAGEAPSFELPLCYYDGERLRTFYIGWYIRDAQRHPEVPRLSPAQQELLDLIDASAADPELCLPMRFEPGDIQLLKNSTILHARAAYEDWREPERKRHLLRLWLNPRQAQDGRDARVRAVPSRAGASSDADYL